jgi:nicotinate-nucleotide pyrophosphorylase (carboxylating)
MTKRAMRDPFGEREWRNVEALIALALVEDLGQMGDITSSATIPSHAQGAAHLVARAPGILAGLPVVESLAAEFELGGNWTPYLSDGDRLEPGLVIARLAGPMRSLLALERLALNFLQRLSGIATLTARFVAAVAGTRAAIYDTRKTTPGWRALEKYAVRCGGGRNHRFGLHDAVLIKDNHLAWLRAAAGPGAPDPIAAAIAAARAHTPAGTTLEVEVDSLDQLDVALRCGPDIILIDNLGAEPVAEAVRRRDALAPGIRLEASGGVSLDTVAALAATGVDRISVGALTHSAPALDLALDLSSESSSHDVLESIGSESRAAGHFPESSRRRE